MTPLSDKAITVALKALFAPLLLPAFVGISLALNQNIFRTIEEYFDE